MTLPRTPALATDCVIFNPLGRVLLIRRGHEPCAGKRALPGGFVKIGETLVSACRREVSEETGIDVVELALVGVYSDIDRDPRGHIVSVAFMTELGNEIRPRVGSDAMSAEWVDMRDVDLALAMLGSSPTPRPSGVPVKLDDGLGAPYFRVGWCQRVCRHLAWLLRRVRFASQQIPMVRISRIMTRYLRIKGAPIVITGT